MQNIVDIVETTLYYKTVFETSYFLYFYSLLLFILFFLYVWNKVKQISDEYIHKKLQQEFYYY